MLRRNSLVLRYDHLSRPVAEIETSHLSPQPLGNEMKLNAMLAKFEGIKVKKATEYLLMTQADRLEQGRNRHFPAAVNAEEQDVFRIKLEIQPRPAVRNNPCGEQKLTGAMGFPAVVLEKHPRRAVQLRHDHALRSVDDKRSGRRHERNFAHINFLLLHLFDRVRHFSIKDHQPDLRTQRRRKS